MSWPPGDKDYKRAWQDWISRRGQSAIATVIWLGLLLLPALRSLWAAARGEPAQSLSRPVEVIGSILWGASFIAVAITGFRTSSWPCPRCGNPFSQTKWFLRGLPSPGCVHCGLRRDYVKAVYEGKAHVDTSDY